jgi:hypothetical protein
MGKAYDEDPSILLAFWIATRNKKHFACDDNLCILGNCYNWWLVAEPMAINLQLPLQ